MMPPTGTTAKMMKAGTVERYGANLKVNESDCSGIRSSLKISLVPSASVCSSPQGPARFGPIRLCMSEITLRSNQIIIAVAVSNATNATSTLTIRMTQTSQLSPPKKSGSPRPWLAELCDEAALEVVAAVELARWARRAAITPTPGALRSPDCGCR